MIDYWIITSFRLFHRITVDNDLPVTEIHLVQVSSLLTPNEEKNVNYRATNKSNLIGTAFKEIGDEKDNFSHNTRIAHNRSDFCSTGLQYKMFIRLGQACGLREIMALWLGNKSHSNFDDIGTADMYSFSSSGVLVTFRVLAYSDTFESTWKYFTTKIINVDNKNRCHSLEFEAKVSMMLGSEEETNHIESQKIYFWLWFVPTVTANLLDQYPTSSLDTFTLPRSAQKICQAEFSLKGIFNPNAITQ